MSAHCRTGSFSYTDQNGYGPRPGRWDDGSPSFGGRAAHRDEAQLYGRQSPVPPRSPHLNKQGARGRSDPDPFILTSAPVSAPPPAPAREPRPTFTRAERMAALERRMLANGLSPPGQPKPGPVQRLYGRPGVDHVGAVQLIDGSTSSGTDSSDSEAEAGGSYVQPPAGGNPVAGGSKPLPRSKISLESLQLDEEVEEGTYFHFGDEDGGRVFSC